MPDQMTIANTVSLGISEEIISSNPLCAGAAFWLGDGWNAGAPQPTTDIVTGLGLDGERPRGRRASNRTVTLPIAITVAQTGDGAADRLTLSAAQEVLLQAIDAEDWTMIYTRHGGLPMVLDCFRANPAQITYDSVVDRQLVKELEISFPAAPYGRSDVAVQIPLATPLPGQSAPPATVVLDTFTSVSGANFSSSAQCVIGPNSAKWDHTGSSLNPVYNKTGLGPFDITGLLTLSVYVGIGTNTPSSFTNPCTVTFSLTDSAGKKITFGVQKALTASGNASVPSFRKVTGFIPAGRNFNYTAVTGYSIKVDNSPSPLFQAAGFGFNTWYDHVTVNPPSIQAAGLRGLVYNMFAQGTARAPVSLVVQQPGATRTDVITTPGPFQYPVPKNLIGTTVDATVIAGSGAGGSVLLAGQAGGGGGAETAREAALAVTPGEVLNGSVGAGGTPQSSISTLTITTAGLPSGTVGAGYNAQGGAFLKLIDFSFITGQQQNFDGGIGTWVGAGNCTTTATGSPVRQGSGAMVMTSGAAGAMSAAHCTAANILTQGKPCVSGDSINCRAWFRAAVSPRNCQVGATFYTSAGVIIGSPIFVAGGATDTTSGWTFVQGQVTAPATSAFCRLTLQVNGTGAASEVHYADDALLGAATLAQAITQWQALTGRTMAVRREYYAAGVYGTGAFAITTDLTADAAAGRKVCLTLRPPFNPTNATDRTNIATFLASCKAAGLDMDITLWHEPFFAGLTAAQYIAMINFYGPTVRAQYPLVFGTGGSSVQNNNENAYYPGDAAVDKVVTDYYADGYVAGRRLDLPAAPADNAVPPKPFGVWEMNASSSAQTQADGTSYFQYVQSYFTARSVAGKPNAEVLLFNGDTNATQETPLTDALDYRLALWQSLADSVSNATVQATGGTTPYVFTSSTLPAGLTLNASTGVITGTPTAAGTTLVTFTVTDFLGAVATAAIQIRITGTNTLTITTASLPNGTVGIPYSKTLVATGGTTPYTWSLSSGTLPAGIILNGSTGVLSGTPTAAVTARPLTFQVRDSAGSPATDTQALTLTIGTVPVSTLPLFGMNNGDAHLPASWQPVYDFCFQAGESFGYRDYGTPNVMPTAWNNGGVKADTQATFALFSWKPVIASILNGSLNTQINQWAASCQAQWVKNPGSIWVSLWHEGDHTGTGAPTSSDILKLHAYVYPRFKALAPNVPYGQILTAFNVTNSPSLWVSCPATTSGGSTLDFYAIDAYANTSRTAAQVITPAFNAIRSVAPTAKLGIGENNCETVSLRAQWFRDSWQIAQNFNCLFWFPFFWNFGGPGGGSIDWPGSDAATKQAIKDIAAAAAPSGSIALGLDPPAVNGQPSFLQGDAVLLQSGGGQSATGTAGGLGGNISTNTTHQPGGAGAAGAAGAGGSPGTPYTVGSATAASPATVTDVVTITHAVAAADTIAVVLGANASVPNSVTDSKGNTYVQSLGNNVSIDTYVFVCASAAFALTVSDTITVHWNISGGVHEIIIRGCSGLLASGTVDISITANGTSAAPSAGPTATPASASEWVIAILHNGNGGGTPSAWGGGFTAVLTKQVGSGPFLTVADQVITAAAALTASATITSTTWCMGIISLQFAPVSGAGYGGGGGAPGTLTAPGAAGVLSAGGNDPAGFGDGGAGSLAPDIAPVAGTAPGGAGGGAASSGGALQGALGAPGQVSITRQTTEEAFSTLIAFIPGPDAPDNLSPLVSFGATGVTGDGLTEYQVPSLVTGINADFDGTYSIVAVASNFDSPAASRTVFVTVIQYEFAGGPFHQVSTAPYTFTPVTDITNGIVRLGELTLPVKGVPDDNTTSFFTITISDDNANDKWLDCIFIDTMGQLVILSHPVAGAYQTYYLDEPVPDVAVGRVLGSNTDRSSAISVLDRCPVISGGPMTVYPGVNLMFLWCLEGAPQASVQYYPRWMADRLT
jgi:hypothetical protein